MGAGEHGDRDKEEREKKLNRAISMFEAALLALVAVLAAYSGWAAAKWSTESSLQLATASADRAKAAAANLDALNSLNFDLATFNDWFSASVAGNTTAMAIAEKRFSPNFDRVFEAWLATNPETNPDAPPGPTYMPQYHQPAKVHAATLMLRQPPITRSGRRRGPTQTTTSSLPSTWRRSSSSPASGATSVSVPSTTPSQP